MGVQRLSRGLSGSWLRGTTKCTNVRVYMSVLYSTNIWVYPKLEQPVGSYDINFMRVESCQPQVNQGKLLSLFCHTYNFVTNAISQSQMLSLHAPMYAWRTVIQRQEAQGAGRGRQDSVKPSFYQLVRLFL